MNVRVCEACGARYDERAGGEACPRGFEGRHVWGWPLRWWPHDDPPVVMAVPNEPIGGHPNDLDNEEGATDGAA